MIKAELTPASGAIEPHRAYKPSTYIERRSFFAVFCDACRQNVGRACFTQTRAMMFDPSHSDFPSEWTQADGVGVCTAFQPKKGAA